MHYKEDESNCHDCHETCAECEGPYETDCIKCNRGTEGADREIDILDHTPPRYHYEMTCIEMCIDLFYEDDTTWTCNRCSDDCFNCKNTADDCTSCYNPLFLDNQRCVEECNATAFKALY